MWTCRSARITPFFNSTTPLRPDQHAAGRAFDIAAGADRQVDAQRNAVGKGQLDLALGPRRPQNADRRQHPPPRPDDHHRLFGREIAVLIEVFQDGQLVARAEKHFHVLVGQMDVPRGNADHQIRLVRRTAELLQHDLADDLLDELRSIGGAMDMIAGSG